MGGRGQDVEMMRMVKVNWRTILHGGHQPALNIPPPHRNVEHHYEQPS